MKYFPCIIALGTPLTVNWWVIPQFLNVSLKTCYDLNLDNAKFERRLIASCFEFLFMVVSEQNMI